MNHAPLTPCHLHEDEVRLCAIGLVCVCAGACVVPSNLKPATLENAPFLFNLMRSIAEATCLRYRFRVPRLSWLSQADIVRVSSVRFGVAGLPL